MERLRSVMSNVTKILILALAIIGIGTSAAVCAHYFSVNDGNPIHKNSRKDPQGVYEIYNDNVISGEQVKLALSLYKGFDYTRDSDNLDSGMCWIQTGEVREQYKAGNRNSNHLVGKRSTVST